MESKQVSSPRLDTIPLDILMRILVRVSNQRLSDLNQLSSASPRLAAAIRSFRRGGTMAIPLRFSLKYIHPFCGLYIKYSRNKDVIIRKTKEPGTAFCILEKDVSAINCYWQFRIDKLQGHRVDIGIATKDAFRFSTVERAASYSFDCFGRINIAGQAQTFGRQMRAGDVITLIYYTTKSRLILLDNGKCMGSIPVNPYGTSGRKLKFYPFVYMPYHDGETLTLLTPKHDGLLNVSKIEQTQKCWSRPNDLPYDCSVIVQTWCDKVWYAIQADTDQMTLKELWDLLSRKHMLRADLFELIWQGNRLERSEKITLKDVGITIDTKTGTCASDILLSVPHIVS